MGLEAPKPLDADKSKVYDDIWGSSKAPPSYTKLANTAAGSDWLVRSLDVLPNKTIVVRRDDLKQVPRRVGVAWLRCQLHVRDSVRAGEELRLMIQRYLGARMFLPKATVPIGALVCACQSWKEAEVGIQELQEALGSQLTVASAGTHGEIAAPGISLGGVDAKRTMRQGHTMSCCLLSYEP